jgi:undecaprenyl-diphosphatase
LPDLLKAIVLGIVEGVTEFLPISSTGHLVLCERWMGIELHDGFWSMFTIFIQIGAIAAVVVYFRRRLLELLRGQPERLLTPLEISEAATARTTAAALAASASAASSASTPSSAASPAPAGAPAVDIEADDTPVTAAQRGYAVLMILLASTPLVIAYFADKWAEKNMARPWIIAAALAIGGLVMILIEWLPLNVTTRRIERITWKQALGIGGAQVLAALFPGTSRSAATIMAGLVVGLSRPAAAEFSFFLAIPAMGAACLYKLLKFLKKTGVPPADQALLLVIGTLVSFLVAWVVIAGFMAYIRRHSFVPFAVYRIALGLLVLWLVLLR